MIFRHYDFENTINFDEVKLYSINFEDGNYMYKLINELKEQIKSGHGKFLLSDNLTELNFTTSVCLITDYFNIDFNSKNILTNVLKQVQQVAIEGDKQLAFEQIKSLVDSYLKSVLFEVDYPLDFDDITEDVLLKHLNLRVNYENTSFVAMLCDYLSLIRQTSKVKVFVLVNVKLFLRNDEYDEFCKFLTCNDFNIVFINSTSKEKVYQDELIVDVDEDKCEFLKKV